MAFPIINDYKTAFRNAAGRFATLGLTPVLNASGAPLFMAGNFAAVFKASLSADAGGEESGDHATVAVKCFIRDLPDLEKRHQAISDFAARTNPHSFIEVRFLSRELYVKSTIAGSGDYPVVVMPWIKGHTMGEVTILLAARKHQKGLAGLTRAFARMCLELLSLGVAHGDLKHDNVMVTPAGHLKLIDYEAMYVPDLKGLPSILLGGVNYQHPGRDERHFGPSLDHFSMLVTVLSLRAVTLEPELLQRYNTGENIIFVRNDFIAPHRSELFAQLAESPDSLVRDWAKRLATAATSAPNAVPGIERVLKQAEKATVDLVTGGGTGRLLSLLDVVGGWIRR
ncbi:MAG: protein kinase family protein [Alphaproteobacteria bacterium]